MRGLHLKNEKRSWYTSNHGVGDYSLITMEMSRSIWKMRKVRGIPQITDRKSKDTSIISRVDVQNDKNLMRTLVLKRTVPFDQKLTPNVTSYFTVFYGTIWKNGFDKDKRNVSGHVPTRISKGTVEPTFHKPNNDSLLINVNATHLTLTWSGSQTNWSNYIWLCEDS